MPTATLGGTTSLSMGDGLGAVFGTLVGAATGAVGTGAGGAGGSTGVGAAAIAGSVMAGAAVSAGARQNHTPAAKLDMVNVATNAIHRRLCALETFEVLT